METYKPHRSVIEDLFPSPFTLTKVSDTYSEWRPNGRFNGKKEGDFLYVVGMGGEITRLSWVQHTRPTNNKPGWYWFDGTAHLLAEEIWSWGGCPMAKSMATAKKYARMLVDAILKEIDKEATDIGGELKKARKMRREYEQRKRQM